MPVVVGVDSSTQSVKVEARDLDSGEVVAAGSARHPLTQPPASEQDPESWWVALVEAMTQLGEVRRDVVAVSVAGQQHGCVVLDESGRALRPAKLWNDTTSSPQADAMVARLGAQTWAQAVGSVPVASFTITKLAWIAEHEPEILSRISKVMLPHDYLTWRLCGHHVTDRGDASGTGWFSPTDNTYRLGLLESVTGVAEEVWQSRLPDVRPHDSAVAELTAQAAGELGLEVGVIVGPGTGDNMGAALGLGLGLGDVALSLGTSGTAYCVSSTPTADVTGAVAGFADASGRYLPLVATLNATKVTDTVARWLGTDAPGLSALALAAPAAAPGYEFDGLEPLLVPHFDGERTPNLPDATGTFSGLRNSTTREQLALAAHDGVLCGVLGGVAALEQAGGDVSGIVHLIGGGSRSGAYRQRCADLLNRAIVVPDSDETVAAGAAVQAATVIVDRNVDQLRQDWQLGRGQTIEPVGDASATLERLRSVVAASM